ncbi:MAG: GDCCVxC domain-containing (seleno)protein [Rhodomicrobium sp.]
MVQLQSAITCPACGFRSIETMPTDACQYFYACKGCGSEMKPKKGDCCVFCSYGDVPCPPIQIEREGGGKGCCNAKPCA